MLGIPQEPGFERDDALHSLSPQQVYEWVKTGYWSLKDFQEWVSAHDRMERYYDEAGAQL